MPSNDADGMKNNIDADRTERTDLSLYCLLRLICPNTDVLQWLQHIWNQKDIFEMGEVRANES